MSRISIYLGNDLERRQAALEEVAADVGAIGQRGPSISVLLQKIADGVLEVRKIMKVRLNRPAFSSAAAMSTQQALLVARRNALEAPQDDEWIIPAGTQIHLQDLANAHQAKGKKPLEPATEQLKSLATMVNASLKGDWPTTYFIVP